MMDWNTAVRPDLAKPGTRPGPVKSRLTDEQPSSLCGRESPKGDRKYFTAANCAEIVRFGPRLTCLCGVPKSRRSYSQHCKPWLVIRKESSDISVAARTANLTSPCGRSCERIVGANGHRFRVRRCRVPSPRTATTRRFTPISLLAAVGFVHDQRPCAIGLASADLDNL